MIYSYNEMVRKARYYEKQINVRKAPAIAVMDTGVFPHGDLYGRIIAFKDVLGDKVSLYDDNGHGTHICGIIGGSGRHCNRKVLGVSEKCPIVVVKVLDIDGNGKVENVLKGCRYIVKNKDKYNIKIVNISMGAEVMCGDPEMEELLQGVEEMWENGLIVMVAGGNNGPKKRSITVPGNSKKVITVGSSDDDVKGLIKNRNYSGRGPTCDCIIKPDIVTVGSNIMGLKNSFNGYMKRSGTSMATAVASGTIGVFMQKHSLSPKEIKKLLIDSAIDIKKPLEVQGNGQLNIERLFGL